MEGRRSKRDATYVTHVDLLDLVGGDTTSLNGSLDGDGTELDGRERLEVALEVSDGRSGGRGDEDLLGGEGGLRRRRQKGEPRVSTPRLRTTG